MKVLVPNDYPENLHWIPGQEHVVVFFKQKYTAIDYLSKADMLFLVDFNEVRRCGDMFEHCEKFTGTKILIDHHPNPDGYADFIISDTGASATAELVYELIVETGNRNLLDRPIAEALFAGILTDTGALSYNTPKPRIFEIVGELLMLGIDKDRIHANIYDNFSHNRMQLLGYCLNEKMVYLPEWNTAFISITREELANYKFQPGDTEGFVNYPLSIKGVVFTALFMEKDDRIKISFRSKGAFATNKFAAMHFDGGGHLNASGGESQLDMQQTLTKFKDLLAQYSEELKGSM